MMDLLLLGDRRDRLLGAVARHFRENRPDVPLRSCRLEDLASARWSYRLGNSEAASRVILADGHALTERPSLVLNRLRFEPGLLFTAMTPVDRDYARTEFLALVMSWLAGLEAVMVNRPTALGLAGPALRPWQWLGAAHEAGLAPYPGRAGNSARRLASGANEPGWASRGDLLRILANPAMAYVGANRPYALAPSCEETVRIDIIGGEPAASRAVDTRTLEACRNLARSVSADILSVILGKPAGEGWHFLSADPAPAEMAGPALHRLCDWLAARL